MPVVDKLPALLREDLESAFDDDMDSVFDIANLRHSLGQQKRETEIELKQVLCLFPSSPIELFNLAFSYNLYSLTMLFFADTKA